MYGYYIVEPFGGHVDMGRDHPWKTRRRAYHVITKHSVQ